jgi:hypothetical protein
MNREQRILEGLPVARRQEQKRSKKPIESADHATEVAVAFLSQYYRFLEPLRVKKEGDYWVVEVDTGAFYPQVAKVRFEAASGKIVELERPEVPTR